MGLTESEFIKETKEYFTKNPNKIASVYIDKHRNCVYYDENTGNKCAVGRILDFKKLEDIGIYPDTINSRGSVSNLYDYLDTLDKYNFYDFVLPLYKNISLNCLEEMQDWHDELPVKNK